MDEDDVCVACEQGKFSEGWQMVVTETMHKVYCESCPAHSTNVGVQNARCSGKAHTSRRMV